LIGVKSDGPKKEIWFVKQGEGAVRYEVMMVSAPQGGTDFSVTGPLE